MIGVYDYTVILTYLSLISGVLGIIISVTGVGHPEIGIFFLMVSGILDTFDGRVARTKKDRTEFEKNFGIQIDSLADLVCFGILPVSIGLAQLRIKGIFTEVVRRRDYEGRYSVLVLLLVIALFYVLAALIRLAYFNATCDVRAAEAKKTGVTYYTGLPVTASALIFPLVMVVHFYSRWDLTILFFIVMLVMAIAFVLNVKVKKPGTVGVIVIIVIGVIEFVANILAFNSYTG
ncbi:MAG: CDP-alcohol phosphatidyltransferase family protein [Eubacterium sp.]|nr:CDP-alcohol phosphatidyltransferase family protein [Eubacterium sp.]